MEASAAILKGKSLRGALSEALGRAPGLGGQERRFVAFATRDICRHQRLLDLASRLLGSPPGEWAIREDLALARYSLWRRLFTAASEARVRAETQLPGPLRPRSVSDAALARLATGDLPPEPQIEGLERVAARHSFPAWLAEALARLPGEVEPLLAALNEEPGLILRARPIGSGAEVREELARRGIDTKAIDGLADAVWIPGRSARVFDERAMKEGRLQVQDAGSQLIVELCRPSTGFSGARVVDRCAGAGGKTLALADKVGAEGRVEAWDVDGDRLAEARRRTRQWRLRQAVFPAETDLAKGEVILIDAPCSGTGTLARDPDLKWKLTPRAVERFAARQRELLRETVEKAQPGAVIVYATCSLLPEENEDVVQAIIAGRADVALEPANLFVPERALSGPFLRTRPGAFPGAGFFGARLRKNLP
jgi:16S rRNA (cytosine967-C5)-methyltransferase